MRIAITPDTEGIRLSLSSDPKAKCVSMFYAPQNGLQSAQAQQSVAFGAPSD